MPRHHRWWLIGDAVALVAASGLAAVTMSAVHQIIASAWAAVVLGMAAAMLAQMAFAFAAGLLLGSIETQVPTTLGGMLAAMSVCVIGVLVHVPVLPALVIGATLGLILLAWFERYRRTCERGIVFDRERA